MTTITGNRHMTLEATAGETYSVEFERLPILDILNLTDNDIMINESDNFEVSASVGNYITLPAGSAANNIMCGSKQIYIKAFSSGKIVIERGLMAWHL